MQFIKKQLQPLSCSPQCTRNKDTGGPPTCILCKQKGHTDHYLKYARAPKEPPPPSPPALEKATPRRAPARALSATLSYARTAAGSRSVPSAVKQNQSSTADDLKQLMSIIPIIDTNELAPLAKKLLATSIPDGKINFTHRTRLTRRDDRK
ncbi:hypothetical protein EVAR_76429_1 [Eumeta japonica]|uniref:Uncharacterized protein n=1 Tax=Eumeta variegata TaxID=151549 RepID=A0A4C1TBC1_EUMVA|nr:hypothetical protein EVAR_76429_1 [Eumeta japonica]